MNWTSDMHSTCKWDLEAEKFWMRICWMNSSDGFAVQSTIVIAVLVV
jgi:hypothetical protein